MSVGAATQGIDFDRNDLTLVLGENLDLGGDGSRNGTGKTTIINALSYALYGQALSNIRKDNLVNKTNGKNIELNVVVNPTYSGSTSTTNTKQPKTKLKAIQEKHNKPLSV